MEMPDGSRMAFNFLECNRIANFLQTLQSDPAKDKVMLLPIDDLSIDFKTWEVRNMNQQGPRSKLIRVDNASPHALKAIPVRTQKKQKFCTLYAKS